MLWLHQTAVSYGKYCVILNKQFQTDDVLDPSAWRFGSF